LKVQLIQ